MIVVGAISQCHTSDSRRSYQVIKFLVSLATKCPMAKDYLLQAVTKWQWAVNWLQSKVSPVAVSQLMLKLYFSLLGLT